jgi:hypothetical protein
MQFFLYMEGESMGLKSQLLGSIMPARKRFVAMLALSICPLVRISLFSPPSSGDSDAAPAKPCKASAAVMLAWLWLSRKGFCNVWA